jgi:sortase A
VAEYAAGYLHGSGLPGDPGNMALAGHAGLFGGVFRDLGGLAAGDEVLVDAAGWRYSYRVRESKAVWPDQIEVLDPTPTATLTLLTCTNWDMQRLIVVADLVAAKPLPGA